MLHQLLISLRFQIGLAFLALLAVFTAASLYALAAFQRQIDYDTVVDIGARLELTAQQMYVQAMNYKQNAPRDYPTYLRDLSLYYRDLKAQIALFDRVVAGFMSGDLSRATAPEDGETRPDGAPVAESAMPMPRKAPWLRADAGDGPYQAIERLEQYWAEYRAGLMAALGDENEPRLEWAAEHVMAQSGPLQDASRSLTATLRQSARAEHRRIGAVALSLFGGTLLTALVILATLHYRALRPLQRTIGGFHRVTDGDFGYVIPVEGAAEIRELTVGFNALSSRLHSLFLLIDRLQRGNDLDEVVGFLARELRGLLRFDWIGVVVVNPDRETVRLEASALDGTLESGHAQLFRLRETLLERALARGEPLHISAMDVTAAANPRYEFLRELIRRGLNDAVFLPVVTYDPAPAVVAFATRAPSQYDQAHMRFLNNLAQLITESFGQTFRLAERGRLASIGEFASGIAHEMRTPLTTVSLALDHFARLEQPPSSRKRLALATAEVQRMGRLIDDVLLYAKPLNLSLAALAPTAVVGEAVERIRSQVCCSHNRIILVDSAATGVSVLADRDRLLQVLLNLLRNACEASPQDASISVWVRPAEPGKVEIEIVNGGPPIPAELMARAFEPFVSAKRGGTGLGLAIAKRLTHLLGGDIALESSERTGTRALLRLPTIG